VIDSKLLLYEVSVLVCGVKVWDLACGVKFGTLLAVEGSPIDSKLSYIKVDKESKKLKTSW
jgi:hypothetical protein